MGDAVDFGQTVRTSRDGVAILQMPGQGRFVIGPSSVIRLAENAANAQVKLERGAAWIDARLSRGRTLSVSTPHAVGGVRGTKFSVLTDSDGSAVCTCSGDVSVTLPDSTVIRSVSGRFVPVDHGQPAPSQARGDRHLLVRPRGDRYDWCFTCHEIGGRGMLKRGWSM